LSKGRSIVDSWIPCGVASEEPSLLNPGSWTPDPGSWTLGPRSWIPDPGPWILDPGPWAGREKREGHEPRHHTQHQRAPPGVIWAKPSKTHTPKLVRGPLSELFRGLIKTRDQTRERARTAEIAPARAGSSGKHLRDVENNLPPLGLMFRALPSRSLGAKLVCSRPSGDSPVALHRPSAESSAPPLLYDHPGHKQFARTRRPSGSCGPVHSCSGCRQRRTADSVRNGVG
jgi:hypothetical protein